MKTLIAALAVLLAGVSAPANLMFLDSEIHYSTEGLTTASSATNNKTIYGLVLGVSVSHSNEFLVGWNYKNFSTSDASSGTTTTYASTQMGPTLIYFFDRDRRWRVSVSYNLQTSATYSAGGGAASEQWKGTGEEADFGYQFKIGDSIALGLRLAYSSSSFSQSISNGAYTSVSYSKNFLYPAIGITYEFGDRN